MHVYAVCCADASPPVSKPERCSLSVYAILHVDCQPAGATGRLGGAISDCQMLLKDIIFHVCTCCVWWCQPVAMPDCQRLPLLHHPLRA